LVVTKFKRQDAHVVESRDKYFQNDDMAIPRTPTWSSWTGSGKLTEKRQHLNTEMAIPETTVTTHAFYFASCRLPGKNTLKLLRTSIVELWDSSWRLYSVTVGYNQRESCIDNTQLSSCINSNDYKQIKSWIRNHSLTHCFSSLFLSSLFFSANLLITSTIFCLFSTFNIHDVNSTFNSWTAERQLAACSLDFLFFYLELFFLFLYYFNLLV